LALGADGFTVAPPAAAEIAMTMSWAPLTLRPAALVEEQGGAVFGAGPAQVYFREGVLSEVVRKWLAAPARSPRPVKSRGELRALALAQARCAPARRRSTASANGGGIGAPGRRKSIASEDGPEFAGNSVFRRSSASLSAPARTLRLSLTSPTQGDKTP